MRDNLYWGCMKGFCNRLGLVLLVGGVALYSSARLSEPGFEGDVSMGKWIGPWSYGALGGEGSGSYVDRGENDFVRNGTHALRLTVRDNGNQNAVGWTGISQTQDCTPGAKVRAGAWVYCSAERSPPTEGRAMAQLRLEYYRDDYAQEIIPTHVTLSTPFTSSAGHAPDTWHLLQMYDRVPRQAKTLKFSIVLLSQKPNAAHKVVWVDDAFLEFHGPRSDGPRSDYELLRR